MPIDFCVLWYTDIYFIRCNFPSLVQTLTKSPQTQSLWISSNFSIVCKKKIFILACCQRNVSLLCTLSSLLVSEITKCLFFCTTSIRLWPNCWNIKYSYLWKWQNLKETKLNILNMMLTVCGQYIKTNYINSWVFHKN